MTNTAMSTTYSADALTDAVTDAVKSDLAPITAAIDQEGRFPVEFLHKLGEAGGYAAAIPTAHGGLDLGLAAQIDVITQVSRECGATGFLVWCQSTCARYLLHTPNDAVRTRYLSAVLKGEILA